LFIHEKHVAVWFSLETVGHLILCSSSLDLNEMGIVGGWIAERNERRKNGVGMKIKIKIEMAL